MQTYIIIELYAIMHTRYQSFYRLLVKSDMVNIFMIAHCVDSAVNRLWNKISPTVQKKRKKIHNYDIVIDFL